MQTFLVYPDFEKSIQCLDNKRLGKQRIEARQIYNILKNIPTKKGKAYKGWVNHPIVKMWRGYEDALAYYHNLCIQEWIKRGKNNTMELLPVPNNFIYPEWTKRQNVLSGMKSNLLRKDKNYYSKFGWTEPDNLNYIWVI